MKKNFAITGVAGFVAPRHLRAIKETGNDLVAALDPHDSVGILDSYFPGARFFTEFERFDRHIEKLRRGGEGSAVDYVSVCSPNYLHDAHVRLALRTGASAICEKPLVINPWNLDQLAELEKESPGRVYTVLQLRLHEVIVKLKRELGSSSRGKTDVDLTYITRRGSWYQTSWKGAEEKSGGVIMNIGIHFFDMLMWLFGSMEDSTVHILEPDRASGVLALERARVRWFLSVCAEDLPEATRQAGKHAFRSLTLGGREVEFSEGFTDLHTRTYEHILKGDGFGIEDARPSVSAVHYVRHRTPVPTAPGLHPFAQRALESKQESHR